MSSDKDDDEEHREQQAATHTQVGVWAKIEFYCGAGPTNSRAAALSLVSAPKRRRPNGTGNDDAHLRVTCQDAASSIIRRAAAAAATESIASCEARRAS